jgi:HEAT repeat protein
MGLLSWLFGPSKPNVAKLKQARDVLGLIKALSYKGKNSELHEDLSNVVGPAVDALGELRDSQAHAPLIAKLEELDKILGVQAEIVKSSYLLSEDVQKKGGNRIKP